MPPVVAEPAPAPPAPSRPDPIRATPNALERAGHRLFRFLASVRLAVVLLAVLIVACFFGTVYESSFDAKVARAYVYDAWWFNLWLFFLGANLTFSAISRWPWKKRHTGFLVTHLGLILIILGAWVGRRWGIEGTMTLFKGRPANNQLVIDEKVLQARQDGAPGRQWHVEVIGRKPTDASPWRLGEIANGWSVEVIDHAKMLDSALEPKPVEAGVGRPAARVRLHSPRLNQTMERWLLADNNPENNTLDLGIAQVRLLPGTPPAATEPAPAVPSTAGAAPATPAPEAAPAVKGGRRVQEDIVVFAQKPGEQVARPADGTEASGAAVKLVTGASGPMLMVTWRGATWEFEAGALRGKEEQLGSAELWVQLIEYWPDFVLENGQPKSRSEEPNNPAALVRVRGTMPPPEAANPLNGPATPVPAAPSTASLSATIWADPASGALQYELRASPSAPPARGALKIGDKIATGWADWTLEALETQRSAVEFTKFFPVLKERPSKAEQMRFPEGVRVRLRRGAEMREEWVPSGWQVRLPLDAPKSVTLTYGFRIQPLPVALELLDFEVERNEGNDTPAGFKATVKVTDRDGATGTGEAYMNNPFNFPGSIAHTFTGLTYKISQTSWNPENLGQSSVQILRDPGWSLKWIGSLTLCAGIFIIFYLKPGQKKPRARVEEAG